MATEPVWCRRFDGGVELAIRVQPGAKRSEVVGLVGSELKVRVAAPPVDGKANQALGRFLASELGVGKRAVEIVRGERSRSKVVRVTGTDLDVSSLEPSGGAR